MNIIFYISTLNLFTLFFLVFYRPLISLNNILFIMCLVSFFISIQLKFFSDLITIDYPIYWLRLLSIYNIVSMCYNYRVLCKTLICLNNSSDSLTKNYICASWFERESWDLFGVYYFGNLDLRRLLNDYGFIGHALKKDFPLSGYWEVFLSKYINLVSYMNLKMDQSFRFFSILSPWK